MAKKSDEKKKRKGPKLGPTKVIGKIDGPLPEGSHLMWFDQKTLQVKGKKRLDSKPKPAKPKPNKPKK